MEKVELSNIIKREINEIGITLSQEQIEKLIKYMHLILEWNKNINLTAITDEKEIITKHFVDSLTSSKWIKEHSKVIDCGTGAGFPGIPLAILRDDCQFVLIDSLNKRVNFLNEVIQLLKLDNVSTLHIRAEELASNRNYREVFDIAISRAVANMSTLLEYLIPFCKIGGTAICMKGANIENELENSKNALRILNSKIEKIDSFYLPFTEYFRNIIIVKKIDKTDEKYPRKQGKPAKDPLM